MTQFLLGNESAVLQPLAILRQECIRPDTTVCEEVVSALEDLLGPMDRGAFIPLDILTTACENGSGRLCGLAGQTYFVNDVRTLNNDGLSLEAQSASFWSKGCELDHAESCGSLANLALHIWDLDEGKDAAMLNKATSWFARACDLKSALACHTLEHIGKG
ncbi:MAG: hypothetical protein AAFN80_13455 [Pseudomonadota bacterium]